MHWGPVHILLLILFFVDTNLFSNVYIGSVNVLYGPGGLHCAATKAQTMPDASFRPMVLFSFFFLDTNLFFTVYNNNLYRLYIGYRYVVYAPGGLRWAAMKAQTAHLASFGP